MAETDVAREGHGVNSGEAPGPLLLMLHGRGGSESDLEWLADGVPEPWTPLLLRGPVPLGERFQWFSVPEDIGPSLISRVVRPIADDLLHWIHQNASGRRVGVLGYSQGGAVALQMLRRAPHRLDFVITLAGFTTSDPEIGDIELAQRRPPVFWGRGADDAVIPPSDIEQMREFLPTHVELLERMYERADHGITHDMAADVQRFIRAQTDRRPG